MKRLFIVNPLAGKGKAQKRWPALQQKIIHELGSCDFVVAKDRREAIEKTKVALFEGTEQIVAVGGDGTLNALVNAYMEALPFITQKPSLAVLPIGTGSDYFGTIAPNGEHWLDILAKPNIKAVDLGKITYSEEGQAPQYFINMANVGIATAIVQGKDSLPGMIPAKLRYLLPTLEQVVRYKPGKIQVTLDGLPHEVDLLLLCVAKGVFAGGNMRLGGRVGLDDGLFDVTLVPRLSLLGCLKRLPAIFGNGLVEDEKVIRRKVKEVVVSAKDRWPVEFDGEVIGRTDITIAVVPKALNLCFA